MAAKTRRPPVMRSWADSGSGAALLTLLVAGALLVAAYVSLLWSLDGLPFEDMPNHLTRAVILSDLVFHGGQRFGGAFTFEVAFTPYILGDVALMSLVEVLGPYAGGRLWMILVAASLPVSVAAYLRLTGHSAYSIVTASVLALYLGTDWFFVNGFTSFRLAIAWTLLALALWQSHLRSGSPWAYLAYVLSLVAGYLTHLSALLFCAAAVGVVAVAALWFRRGPLARLVCGGLPFVALLGWHVLSSRPGDEAPALWRLPLAKKFVRLASPFQRYDAVTEGALLALFAIACGLMAIGWRGARASGRVATAGWLALAFLGLYVALPYKVGTITYVDVRAVPLVALFVLLGATAMADDGGRRSRLVAGLAIVLAGANLWVLRAHLRPANTELIQYRALAKTIPHGSVVLPVVTRGKDGRAEPYDSAGTFATIEAGALTPYIFAGGAQPYFTATLPWAPGEYWYLYGEDPGEGARLARTYDFVLAMRPFDSGRLPMRTEEIGHNDAAVLLRIAR